METRITCIFRRPDEAGTDYGHTQGGIFTESQVEEAKGDALLQEKLAVRRWDDQAKVPGLKVPTLESYEDMAVRCLSGRSSNSPHILRP
jgi:predicted HD phosphohydrolase